jgi:hypothetical protein
MATPKEIEIEARLVALEFLVGQLFRIHYEQMGFSDEQISAEHEKMRTFGSRFLSVEGAGDPAMTDHMTAEINDAIQVVLQGIEDFRRAIKR